MNEPFDKEALLEEIDDDHEFLAETFQMFTEDAAVLLQQMGEALTAKDAGKVASAAHTIKSMVGNFSAAPAHTAALELEMLAKSDDLSEAPAQIEKVRTEVERLKKALGDLIEGVD